VQGLSIDAVVYTVAWHFVWARSDRPRIVQQTLEWETTSLKVSQQCHQTPNSVAEEHWPTLIGNKLHTIMACISNRVDDSHKMKEFLEFRTAQLDAKAGIGDNVDIACVGRRYSARGAVALASDQQTPQQEILSVPFSGPTPCIVRQSQYASKYKLLGERYIYTVL
jgi:hypothetical protein